MSLVYIVEEWSQVSEYGDMAASVISVHKSLLGAQAVIREDERVVVTLRCFLNEDQSGEWEKGAGNNNYWSLPCGQFYFTIHSTELKE